MFCLFFNSTNLITRFACCVDFVGNSLLFSHNSVLQCCFHSFEFSWFHHTFLHSPNDITCVLFSLQVFVSPVTFVWTCLCVFLYKIELILQKLNSLASTTTSDESNLEFTHSFLHRKKVCWTTFLFYCNIFVFVVFC